MGFAANLRRVHRGDFDEKKSLVVSGTGERGIDCGRHSGDVRFRPAGRDRMGADRPFIPL